MNECIDFDYSYRNEMLAGRSASFIMVPIEGLFHPIILCINPILHWSVLRIIWMVVIRDQFRSDNN